MIVVENKKDAGAPCFDFMIGPAFTDRYLE
jgi:hypothetical protein